MSEGQEVAPVTPTLLIKGAFGVFETPDGGIHLVLRLEGADEDKHMEFSPMMLKAMKMAFPGKGNPIDMLRMGAENLNGH
jgi:hypothetical protein